MSIERHDLDIHPIQEEKKPLFIDEPWLIDPTLREMFPRTKLPESQEDIIRGYGEANEKNESDFQSEIEESLYQLEIYDQIWFVRHIPLIESIVVKLLI